MTSQGQSLTFCNRTAQNNDENHQTGDWFWRYRLENSTGKVVSVHLRNSGQRQSEGRYLQL